MKKSITVTKKNITSISKKSHSLARLTILEMIKASNLIQLFLKKFHSLTRIQDQLIRIVYAYHYDRRHFFCISIRTRICTRKIIE